MSAQVEQPPLPTIEATYKARDVEGVADLYFYRPLGFWLAQQFARIKMTPSGVSILAGAVGVIAGHLYFYSNLGVNLLGMAFQIGANVLDNTDGQLARLTGRQSREGRIIDGLADQAVFVSIYLHLTLRYLVNGHSWWICLLAVAAAISHSVQSAAADYFRNAYLFFRNGKKCADWDLAADLRAAYRKLTWRNDAKQKFLLAMYVNFTVQQEAISPNLRNLRESIGRFFGDPLPDWVRRQFCASAGMLQWWRFIMPNTRMMILFFFIIIGQPAGYFWVEITAINLLLVFLLARQERMAHALNTVLLARQATA